MITKAFISLENSLLPALPGFGVKGRLMVLSPLNHLLRGINFEGSSFNKTSFYATMFVMPLCVPTKSLYFNFGRRIRRKENGDRWSTEMLNLVEELIDALTLQAVPFLSPVESLHDFVKLAKTFSIENPHTSKAIAFALARAGEDKQAISVIDQLLHRLDMKVPWQVEIGDMARDLMSKLIKDPAEAYKQLKMWEAETISNLGLDNFVH